MVSDTGTPAIPARSTSAGRSPRPGTGESSGPSDDLSTPSRCRISTKVARLVVSMTRRASLASAGCSSATWLAIPAFTAIIVRLWATMSCSSRAIRSRSSVSACSASSAAAFAAYSRRTRVVHPNVQVAPIRNHTVRVMPKSSGHGSEMATATAVSTAPHASAGVDRRRGRATATRYRANSVGVYTSSVMCSRVAVFWASTTTA